MITYQPRRPAMSQIHNGMLGLAQRAAYKAHALTSAHQILHNINQHPISPPQAKSNHTYPTNSLVSAGPP